MKRKYEIGFIINPESTEEEVKKIIDSIVDVIKKAKGSVENVDEWGRKQMAYPIQKHNEGIYTFITTETDGSTFTEIERRLSLTEKVIRFVVLRIDDKLKKANKLIKKWKRTDKMSKRTKETESKEESVGEGFLKKKEARDEA